MTELVVGACLRREWVETISVNEERAPFTELGLKKAWEFFGFCKVEIHA